MADLLRGEGVMERGVIRLRLRNLCRGKTTSPVVMTKGFLSHQEGVIDTGEKMGLIAGDGGVKLLKLGSKRSGDKFVLVQNSVSEFDGFEVVVSGKGGSGSRWGSVERDFQGQVIVGKERG